ncbi:MAG: UDP-N-acetylmuramoyl-L-alanine--D-glutamate ligase, partial [Syntrophomonadaceae bacterium]|nr:UDP-N-acetylmuramoyl-L-alanine--D-glutamate ligase [Syntrophomonadaceae bacterium]
SSAGGNIGVALCDLVESMAAGVMVVEVSSFQLETTQEFHPRISAILNITPDHLDRHKTMEEYARIKARIFARQTQEDYLVLNYEDARVRAFASQAPATVAFFSCERKLHPGIFIDNGQIVIDWQGEQRVVASLSGLRLRGKHNLENILCAVGVAWMAGVRSSDIQRSLDSFAGVRHRLEEVAQLDGVVYINDSKGTNPDSTVKALEAFEQPIVLIAGGRAKGGSYAEVGQKIVERVKELVLVGEARSTIREAVLARGMKSDHIHEAPDFRAAVYQASNLAKPGDVVLLSPACASWDMFPSYEHRGDLFCQIVAEIIADTPQSI